MLSYIRNKFTATAENSGDDGKSGRSSAEREGEGLLAMLPDEVIMAIMAKLSLRDIVNASHVSKRFLSICTDISLWSKLKVELSDTKKAIIKLLAGSSDEYPFALCKTLKTCQDLENLELLLDNTADVTKILKAIDRLGGPALKKLSLAGDWDPRMLEENAGCLRNITDLTFITRKSLSNINVSIIWDFFRGVPIKNDCPGIDAESLAAVGTACTALLSLDLYGYSNTLALLASIGEINSLRCLNLTDKTKKRPKEVNKSAFPMLPNLALVQIDNCMLDDRDLQAIIPRCPNLTIMILHNCQKVTNAGVSSVLSGCRQLIELHLRSLPMITCKAFSDVATAAQHLRVLTIHRGTFGQGEKIKQMIPPTIRYTYN